MNEYETPPKEDVAAAIFDVLRDQAYPGTTGFLTNAVSVKLNMGYDRLPPDYLMAVVKWAEARYFAGAVEPILGRLDRIERALHNAWGGAHDDEPEPQPAPHVICAVCLHDLTAEHKGYMPYERDAQGVPARFICEPCLAAQLDDAPQPAPHLDYDGEPL